MTQELAENPVTFLERLKEAPIKHTSLDLHSCEGKVTRDEMITTATSGFYSREQRVETTAQEKERKREARHQEGGGMQKERLGMPRRWHPYMAEGSPLVPSHIQGWLHEVLYLPPSRTLGQRMSLKGQATCHCLPKMWKGRALGHLLPLKLKGPGV